MENCDEFIFYEDLVRRQEKPAVVIPNIPEKLQEAFSILVDSVVALQLENKGALWGSMVKETMKRKKPSFNETYYGFRSFSSLLEDAQRRGVVTLRRDQKSGSYIVEDLGAAARGEGSIATTRPAEMDTAPATPPSSPSSSGDPGTGGSTNGTSGGHTNGRGEPRTDREPRSERRPSAASLSVAPPLVAGSIVTTPVPSAPSTVTTSAPALDEGGIAPESDAPDGEAPSRPRRRRGGRGRGRGREGAERESRPDLEARGEDVPLPLDEDSNPSIPTPPQAAAAYAEVVERMEKTDAPVFQEAPSVSAKALRAPSASDLPPIALPPPARRPEQLAPSPVGPEPEVSAIAPRPAAPAKPTPPVAPVDPSKASFSLLGWLKGGG